MSNRAAIIRTENAGKPVKGRGRNYIEFDMGGGVTRHVATIDPMHYGTNNTEIDTTWTVASAPWNWKMIASTYNVFALSQLNAGQVLKWVQPETGESVAIQPMALNWVNHTTDALNQISMPQNVAAIANDCNLTWIGGYGAGRDFRYWVHPRRLIKELTIASAANLPATSLSNPYLEIAFIIDPSSGVVIYIDGTVWNKSTKVNTTNRIDFKLADGTLLWSFDAPYATDADRNTCAGVFQVRKAGNNLYCTVRIPKTWIDTAVFPISIDPTFTDGYGGDVTTYKDTRMIALTAVTKLYNYGADIYLAAGRFTNDSNIDRFLIEFDISSIPGTATINSATLYFYIADATYSYASTLIDIYDISAANADWVEGTVNGTTEVGSSCWDKKIYNTTNWAGSAGLSTAGTDYINSVIGTLTVPNPPNLGTEFTASLDTTAVGTWRTTNNGQFVRARTESGSNQGAHMGSSDHATTGYRPKLVVDYSTGGLLHHPGMTGFIDSGRMHPGMSGGIDG